MLTTWPEVTTHHREATYRVLNSGVFVDGPETEALEEEAAAVLGWRHAVAVTNGTVAITAALQALGCGPGKVVGVPALTFSGSAIPAVDLGATLRFVDVDPETYVPRSEQWPSEDLDFCLPVHLHGTVAPPPKPVPDDGPLVVDDSCQAPRARTPVARVACVSMNQSKTLWAGEGGLVLTDDPNLARTVRMLRRFGEDPDEQGERTYLCKRRGHNWRTTEFSAALARASLRFLRQWDEHAEAVARILDQGAGRYAPRGERLGVQKYRLRLPAGCDPAEAVERLRDRGVPAGRWQHAPLPMHPAFARFVVAGERFDGAVSAVEGTIIVGSERRPLCVLEQAEAHEWASAIQEVVS